MLRFKIFNSGAYLSEKPRIYLDDHKALLGLIGNEVRIRIAFLLLEESRLCVCDLSEIFGMKIPAVSQHLRKMKDAQILLTQREGTVIYYCINPAKASAIKNIFQ